MLVTLPFTLLLLDYWPLRRCPFLPMNDPHARSAGARFQQSTMPRLVVEKLPLIALSICFSWITFKAQGAAMLSLGSLPWRYRLMNAADAYLAYLWKTLRPLELAHLYPHSYPDSVTTRSTIVAVVAATGLGATSLWIVRRWRRQPYLAVGWCWYLGTLVPVIGLVQIGEQARADRYTYVPLIGIFICAAWSLQELVRGGRVSGRSVSALCLVAFVSFGACTWKQVGYWKNGSTLWRHAIEVSGPYWGACQYLGTDLLLRGRPREALPYLSKAVRLGPLEEKSHFFLGITFMELGDNSSALDEFERAVRLNPENVESHQNLAAVLRREGRSSEAKAHLREALQIYPGWWRSHLLLSDILKSEGRVEDADHHLRQALAINPNALDDFNRPRADISAHYHRQ
jgi:hypothetical protein